MTASCRATPAAALAAFVVVSTALPAAAQTVADNMTCAQAVAQYAANGVIYKIVSGKPLPIRTGTPIGRAADVSCRGRGQMERRYTVRTTDNPRCVISVYCQ